MAIIETGHVALFLPNRPVLAAHILRLRFGEIAFAPFLPDTAVEVAQPVVDLVPARMMRCPTGKSRSRRDHREGDCREESALRKMSEHGNAPSTELSGTDFEKRRPAALSNGPRSNSLRRCRKNIFAKGF
jgi:hypothetical protein